MTLRNFIDRNYNYITIILGIISVVPSIFAIYTIIGKNSLNNYYLFYLTAVCILLLIIFHFRYKKRLKKLEEKVQYLDNKSVYLQSIINIVQEELRKNNLYIPLNSFKNININDLKKLCYNIYYPKYSKIYIDNIIENARVYAYTLKYASPRDNDEKQIEHANIDNWKKYFNDVLYSVGIKNINNLTVLDVGIGNGKESIGLFGNVTNFIGIDISEKALSYSLQNFKNIKTYVNTAENLCNISSSSIDLYISLRTYQSSLFDKRSAILEAYRVLKSGGVIVISIPDMFVNDDGTIIKGLLIPNTNQVLEDLPNKHACEIKDLLEMLCFENIKIEIESPYEIYITGKKGV